MCLCVCSAQWCRPAAQVQAREQQQEKHNQLVAGCRLWASGAALSGVLAPLALHCRCTCVCTDQGASNTRRFLERLTPLVAGLRQGNPLGDAPVDCGAMCMPGRAAEGGVV